MTDVVLQDLAATVQEVSADVKRVKARVDDLEAQALSVVHVAEMKAGEAAHAVLTEAATIAQVARDDFRTIWAHKAIVLFDVAVIIGAMVAGHYL